MTSQHQQGAATLLDEVVAANKQGRGRGITSVCSAHPLVLEAAVQQAVADGGPVLIEATSNQVDQFGGYTGLTPDGFRNQVHAIADRAGLARDRVLLGGDHLGPNRWRAQPPDQAMAAADDLVAAYVTAGFTKIHLDCSFVCAGDPNPLPDELVAARAARLLQVAERAADAAGAPGTLRYVIGTEVPVPGGAAESLHDLRPTSADAARQTLAAHREALAELGVEDAWPRISALVVQPAVEFDADQVVDYDPAATRDLQRVLDDEPAMVFEAHSTDYQTDAALAALVADHWAFLKVGPWLTFALREALFALAAVEAELVPDPAARSRLPAVVEERMLAQPEQWRSHHPGDPETQRLARRYSFSDRARYYWPDPEIAAAQHRLFDNLDRTGLPSTLLSQFLPAQYDRVRRGDLAPRPADCVVDRIRDVLRRYAAATAANRADR